MKKELLLVLVALSFLERTDIRADEAMLCRMIVFPAHEILKKNFTDQEHKVFEKTIILEKVQGKTLLLTTVIRILYYACRTDSPQEKERLLRLLLRSFCKDEEIEWAVDHMHTYVSQYGHDEKHMPWSHS